MVEFRNLRDIRPDPAAHLLVNLAENLRQADVDEIAATTALDPPVALVASALVSDHGWIILADEEPITIFGCAPSGVDGEGVAWMVGSPAMDDHRTAILRATPNYLEEMHARYPRLSNWVDARNAKSIEWLKWAGFQQMEANPRHGPERRLFYRFERGVI